MRNSLSSQELRWKIIYSGTRRDAIKQIEVLLSIIGNRDSKEYQVLVDFKVEFKEEVNTIIDSMVTKEDNE